MSLATKLPLQPLLNTGSEQQGQNTRVRTVFLTLAKILDLLVFFIRCASKYESTGILKFAHIFNMPTMIVILFVHHVYYYYDCMAKFQAPVVLVTLVVLVCRKDYVCRAFRTVVLFLFFFFPHG